MKYHSNNHSFTHDGKTQTLVQWAKDIGISPRGLKERLFKNGGDIAEAMEQPVVKSVHETDAPRGTRTKALHRLMFYFEKHSRKCLEDEIKTYIQTVGALQFYKDFGHLFPKQAQAALDGENKPTETHRPATMVVMVSSQPQEPHFLQIEHDPEEDDCSS